MGFWALGSIIGVTLGVDMYTYRKMGVIRLLVGMMSRDPLPLTTDIVFINKGYEITFAVEDKNFTPAPPVFFEDDPRGDGKGGMAKEAGQEDKTPEHADKKQKKAEKEGGAGSLSGGFCDGADTPMFGAAAPPPTEVVKKPFSCALKDFPMLHKIALTPMCTHKLARSREDLKLQKKGLPTIARSPPVAARSPLLGQMAQMAAI